MYFWNNVVQLLEKRQMSLRALAKELGVSPTSLSNYARGTVPGLDVAVKIAGFFGVSLDTLVAEDGACPPSVCPAPQEHEFLHELVKELGVSELLLLSRLGNQSPMWKLADILASEYPNPSTPQELKKRLEFDASLIDACLLALKRRRLIENVGGAENPVYRWKEPVASFVARGSGDMAVHMKRALQIMLRDVLPAIDRGDGSGHLITIAAKVPEDAARQLADFLNEKVKEEGRRCTAKSGTTEVNLVFGVAVGEGDCYHMQDISSGS